MLKVSVKGLIEYSLRSGDVDFQYRSAKNAARAREGVYWHQKLQKKREHKARLGGWEYAREVPFTRKFDAAGLEFTVRGRADGIIKRDGAVLIEEIKTTETPLDLISGSEAHIAQAKCYAYFYMLDGEDAGAKEINIMLTYFHTPTSAIKEFEFTFSFDELKSFFDSVLDRYASWTAFILSNKGKRDASIRTLPFPYEDYRALQREMCVLVYRVIEGRETVFINAPTGIGKTISTLFPAIKALPEMKTDKIFYLTAKTITRKAALDAVLLMESKGLSAKTVVISAKDKACFLEKAVCEPSVCPYADGHFDRVNAALYDILKNENVLTQEVVLRYSEKHTVCPYEFCLDAALFSDIIICDYNYAFDPRVYLRRFFCETAESYTFLIDEAHNLVDRAREMFSAEILSFELRFAKRIRKNGEQLKRIIGDITDELAALSDKITENDYGLTPDSPPKRILELARDYCFAADKWLSDNKAGKRPSYYDDVLETYFNLNHFLAVSDAFDERFVCCCEKERGHTKLKLFCADPSGSLEVMLKNAASIVFFSATLTPLSYFKRLLGAADGARAVAFPSPFPRENLLVLTVAGISAKFRNRGLFYEDVADYIYVALKARPGNYFAFFPSYAYLESVFGLFSAKYPGINAVAQSQDMSEGEKELFLEGFAEQDDAPFIAFAVLGGMFSEGIDLPGKRLIGAFIISVGLPRPGLERLIISRHFDASEGKGFEYAYVYPGMNKVMQAGGRVVRTREDRGIIILMDERFALKSYNELFPSGWAGFKTVRGKEAFAACLTEFWDCARSARGH